MNGTMIANLVSGLFCISKDNCRSRKKVLIDRRARSTSPQGSRLVKSIPVKGVTFCCQTRKKKNISPFPHFKDYDALYTVVQNPKKSTFQHFHFQRFLVGFKSELTISYFLKKGCGFKSGPDHFLCS